MKSNPGSLLYTHREFRYLCCSLVERTLLTEIIWPIVSCSLSMISIARTLILKLVTYAGKRFINFRLLEVQELNFWLNSTSLQIASCGKP